MHKDEAVELYELASKYKRLFTQTEDGQAILEDLKKAYCKHTTYHPDPITMGFREGHRDVILHFDVMIALASKPIDELITEENENAGYDYADNDDNRGTGHYI